MESEAPRTPSSDLLSLNLDRLTPHFLKSKDEISRHSIDTTLEAKPIEKAVYFLSVGDDIQQLSVVQSLIDLFRQDPSGCSERLIPKMQQNLPTASSEFHLATSVTVKSLMERKIIPLDTFVQSFLQTILIGTEHRDPAVADAWVECLIYIIPNLPASVLQREILQLAVSKAAHQKPVLSRISSCRIIGVLSKKYSSVDAKRDLVPIVLSLCQDVNADVRAAITLQIPSIVRLLGSETSKNLLLPAMVDLASDEVPRVKEAAFTALVESIPFFSTDVIKTVVLPLLVQLMNYAFKYDTNVLLAVASGFGKMITGLERVMQHSDQETYLHYYSTIVDRSSAKLVAQLSQSQSLTKMGSATGQGSCLSLRLLGDTGILCRQYCAYNFPAMAKFLYSDTSSNHLKILHQIFVELLSDPSPVVRRSVTVSLHEVVVIYGKYKMLLKPEVCRALRDTEEEVLSGFINQLAFILVNFIQLTYSQNEQICQDNETLTALVACERLLSKSSNWRLHTQYIEQMEILWYLFPTQTVYTSFILRYFEKLYVHRALPIRMAYIRTIMMNVKYTPKELLRVDALNKINELAASHSFYDRMLFIRACDIALEIFSTSFFKEYFFFRLMQMGGDPVANIRWGLCRLLPQLYSILKLPADKELSVELDRLRDDLSKDPDTEVLVMLDKVTHQISATQSISITVGDQKKYDEEKKVFSLNSKLVQNFPASCAKMLEPTIRGTPIMRRSSFVEVPSVVESTGTQVGSSIHVNTSEAPSGPTSGGKDLAGNTGLLNLDYRPGFSDEEFLVDAGVALPTSSVTSSLDDNHSSRGPEIEIKPEKENINKNSSSENNNVCCNYKNKEEIMERIAEKTLNMTNNNMESVCPINQALIDYIVVESLPPNHFNSESEMINELVDVIAEQKLPPDKNNLEKKQTECEINQALIDCIVGESVPPRNTKISCGLEKVKFLNGSVENNNIHNKHEATEIIDAIQHVKIQSNDQNTNNINQNGVKSSPKKIPVFKPSIPVRRKPTQSEQSTPKQSEGASNAYTKISIAEKRRSLQVRSSNKFHGLDLSQVEKRRSLQAEERDKRLSLEVVDINKNVTDRSDCDQEVRRSSVVQRRRRSQLPRPLSCVVLPIRDNAIDKNNTNSKLPIIRRN